MVATELGEEVEVQQTAEQTWWDTALMSSGFNVEIPELHPQEVTISSTRNSLTLLVLLNTPLEYTHSNTPIRIHPLEYTH